MAEPRAGIDARHRSVCNARTADSAWPRLSRRLSRTNFKSGNNSAQRVDFSICSICAGKAFSPQMPFGVAPAVKIQSIWRDGLSGYSGYPSNRRPLPLKYSSGLPSMPVLDKYWHNRLLPLRPEVQIAYPRLVGSERLAIPAETR